VFGCGEQRACFHPERRAVRPVPYRNVLRVDPPNIHDDIERACRPERLSAVYTRDEMSEILAQPTGVYRFIIGLPYGTGMRLSYRNARSCESRTRISRPCGKVRNNRKGEKDGMTLPRSSTATWR
jgi:hypothetical protein